jgi:GR25 family glycosyltransferase involved in LPS biosynthesis
MTCLAGIAMEAFVISMDENSDRFRRFAEFNSHLKFSVFKAIDGRSMTLAQRVDDLLLTEDLAKSGRATDGTVGCAASHRELWKRVAASASGALIMEDDVFTHPQIHECINMNKELFEKQHIIHFSMNTDSVVDVQEPSGLRRVSIFWPKNPNLQWIESALRKTLLQRVGLSKLFIGFGTSCYFLSVRGAQALLKDVFPLRLDGVNIPLISKNMPQLSIDRRLNALYKSYDAFLCTPFLAYSPNDDSATR